MGDGERAAEACEDRNAKEISKGNRRGDEMRKGERCGIGGKEPLSATGLDGAGKAGDSPVVLIN